MVTGTSLCHLEHGGVTGWRVRELNVSFQQWLCHMHCMHTVVHAAFQEAPTAVSSAQNSNRLGFIRLLMVQEATARCHGGMVCSQKAPQESVRQLQ